MGNLKKLISEFALTIWTGTTMSRRLWENISWNCTGWVYQSCFTYTCFRSARSCLKKPKTCLHPSNTDRVIKVWNQKVEDWESTPDLKLYKIACSFTRRASICTHKEMTVDLERELQQKGIIPTVKAKLINILGVISQVDVIAVSLQKGQAVSGTKKRKN